MGVPLDPSRAGRPDRDRRRSATRSPTRRTSRSGGSAARRPRGRRCRSRSTRSDQYGLWESDFFKPFKPIADITGGDRDVAQTLAQQLDPMLGLRAAHRGRHVHLPQRRGDAVDRAVVPAGHVERAAPHLAGDARRERDRVHDAPEERAAVGHAVARRRRLLDRQREPAARRAARRALDEPLRAGVREPRSAARRVRLPAVHARVLPAGAVRRGRAGGRMDVRPQGRAATSRCARGGRRTGARTTIPAIFTHGLRAVVRPRRRRRRRQRVAHPGRRRRRSSATSRRSAPRCSPTPCRSRPGPPIGGLPGGFDVSYESPTEGAVSFGTTGPLAVKGADVALDTGKRYDNPWALANFGASAITIADTAGALKLDFAHGSRVTSVTGR